MLCFKGISSFGGLDGKESALNEGDTMIQSLGQEDPLEKGIATHSSDLACKISWADDESERGEGKSWLKAQHSENEDQGIWSHHFMANRWGNSYRLYFLGF